MLYREENKIRENINFVERENYIFFFLTSLWKCEKMLRATEPGSGTYEGDPISIYPYSSYSTGEGQQRAVILICAMRHAPFQFSAVVTCIKSGVYVRALSVAQPRRRVWRRVSSCPTRVPPACYLRFHTELTMRLIKPAVSRLCALFPWKVLSWTTAPLLSTSSRLRARRAPLRFQQYPVICCSFDGQQKHISQSLPLATSLRHFDSYRSNEWCESLLRPYRSTVPRGEPALLCDPPCLEDRAFVHRSKNFTIIEIIIIIIISCDKFGEFLKSVCLN